MKKAAALILAICLVITLSSCGKSEKTAAITLTDQAGRTVTLEKTADKVVSCYYVTTYAMLSLDAGDQLAGIEKKAESRPIYAMAKPELLELAQVGSMKELNVEAIAALEPELVLMPKKLMDYIPALEAIGAEVLVVDPEDDARLREMLTLLAEACGKEENGKKLLQYIDDKRKALEKLGFAETPSVLLCGNSSYLTAAPSGMYQSTLIEQAGGMNAAGTLDGNYWTEISYETIFELNPDVVVIPSDADYTVEEFCGDSELAELEAVKNGKVYKMPGDFEAWDAPIPSGILGTCWLLHTLHSDVYSADELREDIRDFYENFYGFTPEDELLSTIG